MLLLYLPSGTNNNKKGVLKEFYVCVFIFVSWWRCFRNL